MFGQIVAQHLNQRVFGGEPQTVRTKCFRRFDAVIADKIGLSLDKTFASIDKKLTGLGAENNIYTYFIDEVMRDAEILIKHYAFDKVDYFIDSLAKCYLKGYFPYTWEGKYPEGYIKYLA